MKILQICPGAYQSGRGGISEHVRNISERLAKRHEVTVYATNPASSLRWFETVNGVKIRRFKRFSPSGSYFFSPNMIINLREECFDVVHGHSYHALPMHFAFLAKHQKLIFSTHFHGAGHTALRNSLFRLFKPIGKMSLRNADAVIAVSEFEKRTLCASFNIDPSKVVVVPNGLDISEFAGLKRGQSACRSILYVGRLERYKGVQHLVGAMPTLDDAKLKIVGTGPQRRMLEALARQLRVQDRVFFLQNLSRRELLQTYVDADVLVLLSEHEAYSMVVAEALIARTPCVVADTAALSEWIDNKSCFGIDLPINRQKLTELINRVIETRRKGKLVFQEKIKSKIPDWNSVVEQLVRVYAQ
jgi:1,2-diacylglycerol 3-alpha-glucosyltransferase